MKPPRIALGLSAAFLQTIVEIAEFVGQVGIVYRHDIPPAHSHRATPPERKGEWHVAAIAAGARGSAEGCRCRRLCPSEKE